MRRVRLKAYSVCVHEEIEDGPKLRAAKAAGCLDSAFDTEPEFSTVAAEDSFTALLQVLRARELPCNAVRLWAVVSEDTRVHDIRADANFIVVASPHGYDGQEIEVDIHPEG
jgi:hypothetical protein